MPLRSRVVLMLCLSLASSPPTWAWGERGHRMVNAAAVENLPEPLRSYFRARTDYWLEHASDPDVLAREEPEERPHHYTEVEAYDSFPFARFRKQFVDDRRGPTAAELRHGDSLWQIERFTLRLAADLRRGRWADADRNAVFAAHYACDLTQPLHTTLNYDGQLTGQEGIHTRFETTLVNALADGWVLKPPPAGDKADLRALIFQEYLESYNQRNLVFASDRIARTERTYLDPQFMRAFESLAGPVAKKRLEAAAFFVSSLWYTAWVRAGTPRLETGNWRLETGAGNSTLESRRRNGRERKQEPKTWKYGKQRAQVPIGAHTRPKEQKHQVDNRCPVSSFHLLVPEPTPCRASASS